jgi:hypothetical protein
MQCDYARHLDPPGQNRELCLLHILHCTSMASTPSQRDKTVDEVINSKWQTHPLYTHQGHNGSTHNHLVVNSTILSVHSFRLNNLKKFLLVKRKEGDSRKRDGMKPQIR